MKLYINRWRQNLLLVPAIFFVTSLLSGLKASETALQTQQMQDRPNILWVCTDQQRWNTIHALGNEYIQTPNLDNLVQEGVAFNYAHCTSPICTPIPATFLTGLYPSTLHAPTTAPNRCR